MGSGSSLLNLNCVRLFFVERQCRPVRSVVPPSVLTKFQVEFLQAYSPPSRPPRQHQGPFNWYQSLALNFRLNRLERTMSTSKEVSLELLLLDGSNYTSWSTSVLDVFRTMGPQIE